MRMVRITALALVFLTPGWAAGPVASSATVTRAALLDRIHGGWAGMLIGGIEGLPHEFKYRVQLQPPRLLKPLPAKVHDPRDRKP